MIPLLDDDVLQNLMESTHGQSHGVIPIGLKRLGIDIGDSFLINDRRISITRIADKGRAETCVQKYPAENLRSWPYPIDSEMKACPFNKEGSVAIVAPNRNRKAQQLLVDCYEKGADAVGFCHTPHVGVERIIGNLVGNPNYRYLFVVGPEGVFGSGRSLVCAHRFGIDWESGLVRGTEASVSEPILLRIQRLGPESGERLLGRFRDQVTLIDLIGHELSAPCVAFLARLCTERRARFEVAIGERKYLLTAKGAFEENSGVVEPIAFTPKELALISAESAGSFQTSSLLVESLAQAYELVVGTALEHGRPATLSDGTEGLHIRDLSVLCEDPLDTRIPKKVMPEGVITQADEKKEFLDKYAFWTYLIPCSGILWKQKERTAVPRIAHEATYGTRLCVDGFGGLGSAEQRAILEFVARFQEATGGSLPDGEGVLQFYAGLAALLKQHVPRDQESPGWEDDRPRNQLWDTISGIRADIEQGTVRDCYTLVVAADQIYEVYLAPRGGELKLETVFVRTRENVFNWFPRAYGGAKLGAFIAESVGIPFAAYVHQSKFFEMGRANVSTELYDRRWKEAFERENARGMG
ncbi:MAG: hypothetical protein M1274_01990 [Actinobacteria bacterium]|nr:hypothetical protein [Actinomycetota bacterium]